MALENAGLRQGTTERRRYSGRVFGLVCVWLVFVMFTITAAGLGGYPFFSILGVYSFFGFRLSDNVLIALLTSSTATVLGVLLIVVRYLFPSRNGNKDS